MADDLGQCFTDSNLKMPDDYDVVVHLGVGGDAETGNPLVYLGKDGQGRIAVVEQCWLDDANSITPRQLHETPALNDYEKNLADKMYDAETPVSHHAREHVLSEMGKTLGMDEDYTRGIEIRELPPTPGDLEV